MTSTAPTPAYQVRLAAFEGPLDLLLHLIDEAQVDIHDIPIADITRQYLGYITEAQTFDLEVAAEFLVMAATLMLIKARTLVPQAPPADPDDPFPEGDEGIDPREDLVQRLLEYRRFREVAKVLQECEHEAAQLLSRGPTLPQVSRSELPLPAGLSLSALFEAFQRVVSVRVETTEPFRRIPSEEINVGMAMRAIYAIAAREGSIAFERLFAGVASRSELIATFLGLLELARLRKVAVHQELPFASILISVVGSAPDDPQGSPSDR